MFVADVARSGSSAPSPFVSLERTIERTIEVLTDSPVTPQAKALLIEARRLRSVIANWRSLPPTPDVHDEMLERVLQLSTAAGANATNPPGPEAPRGAPATPDRAMDALGVGDDTETYTIDFEPHFYSFEGESAAKRQAIPPPPHLRPQAPGPASPRADGERPSVVAHGRSRPSSPPPDPRQPRPADDASPMLRDERRPLTRSAFPSRPDIAAVTPARVSAPAPMPRPRPAQYPSSSADLAVGELSVLDGAAYSDSDLAIPRTMIEVHPVTLAEPVNPLLVTLAEAYSPPAEAYRTLRRKLVSTGNPRVIAITSAHPSEGKTVLTLNLAITLRSSTRGRVLVVEANLRSPCLTKMLGFNTPACFLEQVAHHADDPRLPWIAAEPLSRLHVMAVDTAIKHEPILNAVAFANAMDQLRLAGYEYILVDTPPVLGTGDVNVIADAVEGMLFAALPMKSRRREMRKAVEQLAPAPILGVVVLEA